MGFWNFISRPFSKKKPTFPNPSDADLHALLSQAAEEYRCERHERAEILFLQALGKGTSSSAESLVEYNLQFLQFLWLQTEAYPRAIEHLSEFIGKFKNSSSAYRYRATVYWYSGHPSEASADFTEVLRVLTDDVDSLLGRGQVLEELGKPAGAKEDLSRALQLLNKVPNASDKIWASSQAYTRNGIGAAWSAMGDFPKAMGEFDLSIALRPENAWVYFNRAETFKKMKQFSESLRDYRKALTATDPKLPAYKIALAKQEIQALENSLNLGQKTTAHTSSSNTPSLPASNPHNHRATHHAPPLPSHSPPQPGPAISAYLPFPASARCTPHSPAPTHTHNAPHPRASPSTILPACPTAPLALLDKSAPT